MQVAAQLQPMAEQQPSSSCIPFPAPLNGDGACHQLPLLQGWQHPRNCRGTKAPHAGICPAGPMLPWALRQDRGTTSQPQWV